MTYIESLHKRKAELQEKIENLSQAGYKSESFELVKGYKANVNFQIDRLKAELTRELKEVLHKIKIG